MFYSDSWASSSNSGVQWQNQLPPQLQQVPLQQLAQDLGPPPPAYRPKNPVPVLLQPQPLQASGINMAPNNQHQAGHSPEGKSIIINIYIFIKRNIFLKIYIYL